MFVRTHHDVSHDIGSSQRHEASYLHDAEISDDTIGRALSSPLFTQEREEAASRRQAYHSFEESLLPSQSLSVGHVRTGRLFNELSSLGSSVRENPSRDSENEQIRILSLRQEIQRHEFEADYDRSFQKLNGIIEVRLIVLLQETNNFDEINNFFMNNNRNKIGNFVKLVSKVFMRWKN